MMLHNSTRHYYIIIINNGPKSEIPISDIFTIRFTQNFDRRFTSMKRTRRYDILQSIEMYHDDT